MRGFLRRVTRDRDVDDLAQQAFVTAWRRAGQYRGQGTVGAWLLGIAWGVFLMERRGLSREQRRREAFGAVAETQTIPSPDAAIDAERVLATLDPPERAALVLTLGMGHSQSEAATILDMPLGTLKTVQARARAKAAAALEGGRP